MALFISRSQIGFIKTITSKSFCSTQGETEVQDVSKGVSQRSVSQAPLQAIPLPSTEGRAPAVAN